MRNYVILCCLILLYSLNNLNILAGNNDLFKFKSQYILDSTCTQQHFISSIQYYNNCIYYNYSVPKSITDSSVITYFKIGTDIEKYTLVVPTFGHTHLFYDNFIMNDNFIIITDLNNCFIFKKDDKISSLIKIINTKRIISREGIFLKTNKLYLLSDSYTCDSIAVYAIDLNSFKCDSFLLPLQNSKEYLMLSPRKPFDVNGKYLAISELNDYSIKFYDLNNFKLLFEINKTINTWNKVNNPYPDSLWVRNPAVFFNFIKPKINNLSLIQKIYLLNNNELLVIWIDNPNSKTVMTNYDIWDISSSSPVLTKSKSYNIATDSSNLFEIETYHHLQRFYSNGRFYSIEFIPSDIKNFKNKTVADLKKYINEYCLTNDPRFSLFEWEFHEK